MSVQSLISLVTKYLYHMYMYALGLDNSETSQFHFWFFQKEVA